MPKASSRRTAPETDSPWRQSIVGHADVDPRTLTPHPQNWRTHPATQTAALHGSLNDLGWIRSLTVNQVTGHILDGEDRLTLALAEGALTVPVEYVALSPEQEAQALLMLDPIAALAGTDTVRLAALLQDVQSGEPAIQQMLSELAQREGIVPADGPGTGIGGEDDAEPQIDRAEELREHWGVEAGQLWACGEHKVIVGDCTDKGVVERLMGGEQIEAVITDPPYGIGWDTDYTRFAHDFDIQRVRYHPIVHDEGPFDPRPWLHYPKVTLWGANWYCQHIPLGSWLVWDKRHATGSAILSDAELAWMKGKRGISLYAETVQGAIRKERSRHPTQKPVGLMQWCLEKAEVETMVLDPYLGSGTTLIACEHLHRRCFACEIDPGYVAVTLQRYREVTGEQPTLIP